MRKSSDARKAPARLRARRPCGAPLGDYLATGYDLFTWIERRQPDQRWGSELFKDWAGWQLVFTNVAMARDGYGGWGYSAIVGDGSIARLSKRRYMTQYGSLRQAVQLTPPAGSILIAHYSVWHRSTTATASGIRDFLKYTYRRTTPLQRDWIVDPQCDFTKIPFGTDRQMPEKWHDSVRVARLFLWLCGREDFVFEGGQAWPMTAGSSDITSGMPLELDHQTDPTP